MKFSYIHCSTCRGYSGESHCDGKNASICSQFIVNLTFYYEFLVSYLNSTKYSVWNVWTRYVDILTYSVNIWIGSANIWTHFADILSHFVDKCDYYCGLNIPS